MPVPLNVLDYLDRGEAAYPDRIAVVDDPLHIDIDSSPGILTYSQFADRARAQAASLDDLDIEPGKRIAILSQNSSRLLTSFFGVSGWGRVLVPLNYRLSHSEIKGILDHSGAEVLYVDPSWAEVAPTLGIPHTFVLGKDDAEIYSHGGQPVEWSDPDENVPATLNYTSGTTGSPKGVELTHRSLWLNAATFALHIGLSDRDVLLHTLPMFHVNGWGTPYALSAVGGKHIVLRQIDGREILNRIAQHDVTILCAAPTVIDSILAAAEAWHGDIPGRGKVRAVVAGAPPPTRTIERVETVLGWEFIQIYGQTETSPLITVNRRRQEWDVLDSHSRAALLRRAGVPALGVKVRIQDLDGEILTRSNHNLKSYWRNEDATNAVGADAWVHTGDVGRFHDDGSVEVTDRIKDIVITGGENVSSVEVEEVLGTHPSVAEAAVIGVPDQKWGELVTALVVVSDSAVTADQLVQHCRESLAGYKCPKRVVFVDSLVRTATGKLQKHKLRDIINS